jgi:hypothetical protein
MCHKHRVICLLEVLCVVISPDGADILAMKWRDKGESRRDSIRMYCVYATEKQIFIVI